MKKILAFILTVIFILSAACIPAYAEENELFDFKEFSHNFFPALIELLKISLRSDYWCELPKNMWKAFVTVFKHVIRENFVFFEQDLGVQVMEAETAPVAGMTAVA